MAEEIAEVETVCDWRRETVGYVASAVVALAGCAAIIAGRMPYLDDTMRFNLPLRAFVWGQWRAGHVPLWWPDVLCGTPVAGEGQAGIFYPLNLLGAAFANPVTGYCVVFVLTYVMAATGMYALGRMLGLSRAASVAASAVFALGGPMVSHHPHMMMVEVVALWPWTFAAGLRAVEGGRRGWWATAAMLVALQWMAFSPQAIVIGGIAFLWLAAWDGWTRGAAWRAIGGGVGFYAMGTVAAAIAFLPAAEYWRTNGAAAIPASWTLDFPSWPIRFVWLGPVLSEIFGGWKARIWGFHWSETCLFAGVAASGLAVGGALSAKVRQAKWFAPWATLTAAATVFGCNHVGTMMYKLLSYLPLLKGMRCHTRVAFVVVMGIAVLAGLAIDALGDLKVRRRVAGTVFVVWDGAMVAMAGLPKLATLAAGHKLWTAIMDLWPPAPSTVKLWAERAAFWQEQWTATSPAFLRTAVVGAAMLTLVAAWGSGRKKLLALIVVAEMVAFFAMNVWTQTPVQTPAVTINAGRVCEWMDVKDQGNQPTLSGVPMFNGVVAEAIRPGAPDELADAALKSGHPEAMSRWGVFSVMEPGHSVRVLEGEPLRAWAAKEIVPAKGRAEALAGYVDEVKAGRADVITVEGAGAGMKGAAARVTVADPQADEVAMTADADGPAAIVLANAWYPGWHAWVDGKPTTIHRAGGYFRCVMVEGGRHEIVMRYEPKSVLIGAWVSLIAWLLLLAMVVTAKDPTPGR